MGCYLLQCLKLGQLVLAKYIFIGGVFYVGPRLMASVVRAAADWRRWAARLVTATKEVKNEPPTNRTVGNYRDIGCVVFDRM